MNSSLEVSDESKGRCLYSPLSSPLDSSVHITLFFLADLFIQTPSQFITVTKDQISRLMMILSPVINFVKTSLLSGLAAYQKKPISSMMPV